MVKTCVSFTRWRGMADNANFQRNRLTLMSMYYKKVNRYKLCFLIFSEFFVLYMLFFSDPSCLLLTLIKESKKEKDTIN